MNQAPRWITISIIGLLVIAVWQERQIFGLKRGFVAAATAQLSKPPQPSAVSKAASLELQAKCSDQALTLFTQLGYAGNEMAGQENHYQPLMNRCFVLITNTTFDRQSKAITDRLLLDAFERREFGGFTRQFGKVVQCDVTLPSGDRKVCRTDEEFDHLIASYMGTSGAR